MTKLNKTNLGVAGDGTSLIVVNDTGRWGAPSGANHFRFVSTGGTWVEDNLQQLYKGPFRYANCYSSGCIGAGPYADTFDADDPAWKFQGTIDSCEGATNDGQVPGPTLGSRFFWKFWLTDQNLLDNIANGAWDPEWYVELLDPNEVQKTNWSWPDQTYKVFEETLLDESGANGTAADGERCIGVYVDETHMWWRDPLNRNWGVFNTSDDEPKLTARIWQKLPFMTSVEDAKTFWNNVPSHEETIYLRDAVIPHMCEVRKGSLDGPVDTGYEALVMGETYYLKHRYFGPARYNNANFKVATSIFMEPNGLGVQPMMDRFWMTNSENFGLTFIPGTTHHWEWDTENHSTLYNELGASAVGGYESWVVPLVTEGTWPPDYWYDSTTLPQYWIGGGPIDPNTNEYQEQVRPYGDDMHLFEQYIQSFEYSARRKISVILPKELEITNNADGTKIFAEGTPSQFKVRIAHVPPDDDGMFKIWMLNAVTTGSFGGEDIDWVNTVEWDPSTFTAGWAGEYLILYDSDRQLVDGMYEWISPQITFVEDFEFEESTGDNGSQQIEAFLHINGSYVGTEDTFDITSLDIQQNLWLTQEVDLGKTMPVAAWGRAAGDPVKSVYLLAGLDNFIKYKYTGFDQDWWDTHNAQYPGLEEPLIKNGAIKWSIRPAGGDLPEDWTLKHSIEPNLFYEHGLDLYRASSAAYTNNPDYALVNTKAQYDWLSTAGNDFYLVASTGATEEVIGVWLIEPLYPELGGSVGSSSSTTDPATIPVIDENIALVTQRPRLELTMKTKDGGLPSYDVRELFYQGNLSNTNADNVRAYINIGGETTQADQNDFDFTWELTDYSSSQPAGGPYYFTRFNYYPWSSTNTKLVFELSDINDNDPIEGRQVVTFDLGVGRTVLGDDQNSPVDFNGDLLDRKRFTLNDDYLYSNIGTSFTRITSTDDYGGTWPHAGQAAPDLNYPQQDEIGSGYCYKGQGMKMTLNMSHADIPIGTKVRFKFQPPATTNPPAPGWTLEGGFFYKEFEKTDSASIFTEVLRPDICGTFAFQQGQRDYSFEIVTEPSLSDYKEISSDHYFFVDQDQFDSEVRLRRYIEGESGQMRVESDLPHEITEDDMNAGTWDEFYTTFCFRDAILNIGNIGVFEGHGTSGLPCFIVFEDISHLPTDPGYKTIDLDVTKGGGGTLATIDGKSGLLTEVKIGTQYDNDGAWIWNPGSASIAYFATAYGKISPDSDHLESTIRATVYLGVDATTTNLNDALFTRSINIVTASENTPLVAQVLNDTDPWLFTESKTVRLSNNTAASQNFYVCFVDHFDNLVPLYQPRTIAVDAYTTVDHVITLDDAIRKNYEGDNIGGNCLVAVFDTMPQIWSNDRQGVEAAINQHNPLDLLYSKDIPFKSGWFSWSIEPAPMRNPAQGGGASVSAGKIWFPSLHTSNTTKIYFNTDHDFGLLTMKFDINFWQDTALAPVNSTYNSVNKRYMFQLPESWSNANVYNLLNPYLGEYATDANTYIQVEPNAIMSVQFSDMTPGAEVLMEYSENSEGDYNNFGEISAGSTYYYEVVAHNIPQAPGFNNKGRMRAVLNTTGNITTSWTGPTEYVLPWDSNVRSVEFQTNATDLGLNFYDQYVVTLNTSFDVISADVGASFYISLEIWNDNISQWENFYNFSPTTVIEPPTPPPAEAPTHVWAGFRNSGQHEGGGAVGFSENTSFYIPFDPGALTKSSTGDRYIVAMYSLRDWLPTDVPHEFFIKLADNTWKGISATVDAQGNVASNDFCMGTSVYGLFNEAIKVDSQNRMEVQIRPSGNNDGTYYGGVQFVIHVIDEVTSYSVTNEVIGGINATADLEMSITWDSDEYLQPDNARALRMFVGASSNPTSRPYQTFPDTNWRTNVYGSGALTRGWWDHGTAEYGCLGWLWDDNLDGRTDSFSTSSNRVRHGQLSSILFT